jgi:RNA-directed DNA polymerase
MKEWCRENRHQRIRKQSETMKSKLQGHYNYYGIMGNSRGINQFYDGVMRTWYQWLNRRSQHRSYTWEEFNEMAKRYDIPKPKVTEALRKPINVQQMGLNYA